MLRQRRGRNLARQAVFAVSKQSEIRKSEFGLFVKDQLKKSTIKVKFCELVGKSEKSGKWRVQL